ncbi:MAG: aspartyl protease family protein [Candidatus Eisenbacteria bacterium]
MSRRLLAAALALILAASVAFADWLQPDPSYRDAQFLLRQALRDTLGHGGEPARLDTLGLALLRLGRFDEARAVYGRALAVDPYDAAPAAAFGKLALFADRLSEAESLLSVAVAAGTESGALADLYATRLRRGDYARAAELAPLVNDQGRVPMLELMAEHPPYRVTAGPDEAKVPWSKGYPIPLMRVKLNGRSVLMALDTGSRDLIVDQSFARTCGVKMLPLKSLVFWDGARIAVQNALVQRLELGGMRIEDLPAGVTGLRKWMLQVNPQAEPVAGVIGLGLLRNFTPTIDYRGQALELRRPGRPYPVGPNALRVPFEIWGESELTVYGSLNGGRRMALVFQSGVGGCGVGAPADVFAEVGVKPGKLARAFKGAGSVLQGRPWAAVSVPNVVVGPLVREKVAGWSGVLDEAELWKHGVRRDAILSHDFFHGQRVTIDWAARELVVEGKE